MNKINSVSQQNLSEEMIDNEIEQQINDESAWEEPIQVTQKSISISLPPDIAAQV